MTHLPTASGLCRSLAEAAVHARRPFMPALVQAKIHSTDRDGRFADVAYYIDARAVIDRLNVLLPGRWHATYELVDRHAPTEDANEPLLVYRCHLSVAEATYTDVGEGPDHKASQSDALKRAAVHIGIGHCVYRITGPRMFLGPGPNQLRRSRRGRFYLDEANQAWLRERYRSWLIEHGVAEYGLPLDHGEVARALAPDLFPARFTRRSGNGAPPSREALTPAPATATPNGLPANGTAPENGQPTLNGQPTANEQPVANGQSVANGRPIPDRRRSTNDYPTTNGRLDTNDRSSAAYGPPTIHTGASTNVEPPAGSSGADGSAPRGRSTEDVAAEPLIPAPRRTPDVVPASPEQRVMVLDAAGKRGYRRETVLALANVVGTTRFDRLDARGLRDLLAFLDSATGGGVTDTELAAQLGELRRGDDGAHARERLAVWLLEREETAAAAP